MRELVGLPGVIARHRELLWSFVWRDLKARYEGSLLGRLWPILNPLILFALFYFVFAVILRQRLEAKGVDLADDVEQQLYGLYIISGILPWIALSEGLNRSTGVVLENANLVKKIAFPSQLLVVYAVLVNLVYFLIGLALFLLASAIFFYGVPSTWPWLLVAIPLQVVFTVGIGMFLGALNIFVRDTSQLIGLVLQLWFFVTPIVYPAALLTQDVSPKDGVADVLGGWAWLMQANPMYHLMDLYRTALVPYYEGAPHGPAVSAMVFAAMALATFLPGHAFYLATKGRFADEL